MVTMLVASLTACTKDEIVDKGMDVGKEIIDANSQHLTDLVEKAGESIKNNGHASEETGETEESEEYEKMIDSKKVYDTLGNLIIDGIDKTLDKNANTKSGD